MVPSDCTVMKTRHSIFVFSVDCLFVDVCSSVSIDQVFNLQIIAEKKISSMKKWVDYDCKYHCVQTIFCCFGYGKNTFGVSSSAFIIRHVLRTVQSGRHYCANSSFFGLSWYNYATVPALIKTAVKTQTNS